MNRKTEVVVGLVIILGIVVIAGGIIWLQGRGLGREERTIVARVREVGQLQDGSPVKLRGVLIGRVSAIVLEERGAGVLIEMNVEDGVPIPEDPVVILSPESLFGDWQVEMFPRTRFPLYNYAESPDPQVIPGYSLPDVSRLTAVADRIAENLAVITERVDIAFTEETAVNIRDAINNLASISDELTSLVRRQEATVRELGEDLQTTTATMNRVASTLERTLFQVEAAVSEGELEAIVDNVRNVSAQLDSLSATLGGTAAELNSALTSADSAFSSLAAVASSIERGEGSLGLLMHDTSLYREIVTTNTVLRDLLLDFQRNPRKYINFSVF